MWASSCKHILWRYFGGLLLVSRRDEWKLEYPMHWYDLGLYLFCISCNQLFFLCHCCLKKYDSERTKRIICYIRRLAAGNYTYSVLCWKALIKAWVGRWTLRNRVAHSLAWKSWAPQLPGIPFDARTLVNCCPASKEVKKSRGASELRIAI